MFCSCYICIFIFMYFNQLLLQVVSVKHCVFLYFSSKKGHLYHVLIIINQGVLTIIKTTLFSAIAFYFCKNRVMGMFVNFNFLYKSICMLVITILYSDFTKISLIGSPGGVGVHLYAAFTL